MNRPIDLELILGFFSNTYVNLLLFTRIKGTFNNLQQKLWKGKHINQRLTDILQTHILTLRPSQQNHPVIGSMHNLCGF